MQKRFYPTLFNSLMNVLQYEEVFGWATGYIFGFKMPIEEDNLFTISVFDLLKLYVTAPFDHLDDEVGKYFHATSKPYKGWYQIIRGLLQPIKAIGNILKAAIHYI